MFKDAYRNRRVLVTGHTGFKGSWLALWLSNLGAKVMGYSLQSSSDSDHYKLLDLDMDSVIGDIRDLDKLELIFVDFQPEIVFHLAAQAIVRLSYKDPVDTFTSNVMGTVNVLEASRKSGSVRAIVNVTSDKCYENREWLWGYRENDAMGGYDPYSASKGCSELITSSYRNSYFNLEEYGRTHGVLLASARAGNVIGGGDWAVDRLVPDIMRAVRMREKIRIRNPHSIRPWQHVLESLSGYLSLGQRLLEGSREFAEAWNFGPLDEGNVAVCEIVEQARKVWPEIDYETNSVNDQPHEAGMLRLDCSKSRALLHWMPVWTSREAVEKTVQWYRAFYESGRILSLENLESYVADARSRHIKWTEE
jgi:CDP-glucose 4,6-dehydratase